MAKTKPEKSSASTSTKSPTRVFFAWELGAGYGHLIPLQAQARELKKRGAELTFAVRELGGAQRTLSELGRLYQAPVRLTQGRNPVKTSVNFASLLHNTGMDDVEEYTGRIAAWRNLMQDARAQLVFADFSPAAIVAARTLGLPVCHSGTGFTVPPLLTPFPSFQPQMNVPEEILLRNENEVLKELNAALARLQLKPFERLQQIFEDMIPGVFTYPELDHYTVARPEPFLGLPDISGGAPPPWPQGEGPKILAYLRPMQGGLVPILEALKACKARVLLRVSGIVPKKIAQFVRPGMTITERQIDFAQAARDCDAFLTYAPHNTVLEFLLAGKPGVLVPDLHERILTARRAVQMGACLAPKRDDKVQVTAALDRVITDPALRQAAEAFAAKWKHLDRSQVIPKLVDEALKRVQ